jgi:two-component system, NtrC family, C4-dicarboxylate transport sensor histidine kinase DctB
VTALAPALQAIASSPHFEELLIRADRASVIATLARGMAHDLRGPLQTLTLVVDPHADMLGGPEAARLRGAMTNAVQHLSDTIARFSQVYAPIEGEAAPLIVEDLLAYVVDLQRYQRSLPAVEVELRLPGGLPPVRAIEAHIRHVLLSLLVNAKQALADHPQGRIQLAAVVNEDRVQLAVEDNGPGLAAEARAHAFEPLYSTREGGLGIGLTVARWLTERQEGRLTLEPSELGGVRAVVSLAAWRKG